LKAEQQEMLKWVPPSVASMERVFGLYQMLLIPEVHGAERIPALPHGNQPLLFVCNHALGGIEMPIFILQIYKKTGIFVRGLSDHIHFAVPVWENILRYFGAIDGTREHCEFLMSERHPLLVYPGGGQEVFKKKTDKPYSLLWKERTGFAKLAISHNYTIIPCCTVGTEDMLGILQDVPVGWFRKDFSIPIITPPPPNKVQKIYIWFGDPISTEKYGKNTDQKNAEELRDVTRDAILRGISEMQERQKQDPERFFREKVAGQIKHLQEQLAKQFYDKLDVLYSQKNTKSKDQ